MEAFLIQGQILGWSHFETKKSYDCILIICNIVDNPQKTMDFHQIVLKNFMKNAQNKELPPFNQSFLYIIKTFERLEKDQRTVDFLKIAVENYQGLGLLLQSQNKCQEGVLNLKKAFAAMEEIFNIEMTFFILEEEPAELENKLADLQKQIEFYETNLFPSISPSDI